MSDNNISVLHLERPVCMDREGNHLDVGDVVYHLSNKDIKFVIHRLNPPDDILIVRYDHKPNGALDMFERCIPAVTVMLDESARVSR